MESKMPIRRRKLDFRPPPEPEVVKREVDEPELVKKKDWLLVLGAFLFSFLVVYYYENTRPYIVTSTDFSQFSEERARRTTAELSEIGPRPSGSEALEVTAFELLKKKIKRIGEIILESDLNRLEMSIQRPSGCFDVDFIFPFTDCYHKITNIAVKMSPSGSKSDHSLLINCHFDTQPDAPGATDDAVSCAIMLDIMEIIARGNYTLKNNIIFLFNGAEESCLQGAHGFITQHPWRYSVRAFVNLEGAGAGGREILFQVGPGNSWLTDVYMDSVPHPSCSIVAQELFQAGIIPSDTDFRIFRDFGRISGLDIAYFQNGWAYHTEFDEHFRIYPGDIQRTGENILALTYALDQSEFLPKPGNFEEENKTVFFDILGRFAFKGSYGYAAFVILLPMGWTILGLYTNDNPYYKHLLVVTLLTSVVPSGLIFVYAGRLFGFQFFWFKGLWLVYGTYFLSYVLLGLHFHYAMVSGDIQKRLQAANAFHDAFLFLINFALFCIMVFQSMIGICLYIALMILSAKSREIIQYIFRKLTYINEVKVMFYSLVLSYIPMTIIHTYIISLVLYLFIPVSGRMGALVADPDMYMFFTSYFLFPIYIWALAPLIHLTDWGNEDKDVPVRPYSRRNEKGVKKEEKKSIFHIWFLTPLVKLATWINTPNNEQTNKKGDKFFLQHFSFKYIGLYYGLTILLLASTSLGTSYKYDFKMPKLRRIHATHMDQTIYRFNGSIQKELSGIVVQGLDFRKTEDLPEEDFPQSQKMNCSFFTNFGDEGCGLPYIVPKWEIFRPTDARLIPAGRLQFPNPIELKMVYRGIVPDTSGSLSPRKRLRLEFELYGGSNNMALHVSPVDQYYLMNSSFTEDRTVLNRHYLTNATFAVTLGHGSEHPGVWKFWFEILPRRKHNLHNPEKKANLEIVVVSMINHGPNQHSRELKEFREKIHEKRRDPSSDWRWLMTLVAATAEVKVYKF